jgi:N-acetylmuramoyl-L-alanine amidase
VTINADATFFIGSADPSAELTVNTQPVRMSLEGAFAYTVDLKPGKNVFNIQSGTQTLTYIITRPMVNTAVSGAKAAFVPFVRPVRVAVSTEGAPMRSTPVDGGINRLAHFPKGVLLNIDGEQGDFFRVDLNDAAKAWIFKGNVKAADCTEPLAETGVQPPKHTQDNEFDVFTFELNKKQPYVIKEGNPLKLTFYNPDYVFEYPVNHKYIGYSGQYEGDKFVLKIRKSPKIDPKNPLKDIKIAIDPGHGGSECGAVGCFKDKEKDINLAISKYLDEELKARGADVFMTRSTDCYVGLKERVAAANKENAAILISVHANAVPDNLDPRLYSGTSIYYYYPQAKPLADSIIKSMTTKLGTRNDGVRQGSLALVRNTGALSILIETAYMINPYDMELLRDKSFQKRCAAAIADGVEDWFKN